MKNSILSLLLLCSSSFVFSSDQNAMPSYRWQEMAQALRDDITKTKGNPESILLIVPLEAIIQVNLNEAEINQEKELIEKINATDNQSEKEKIFQQIMELRTQKISVNDLDKKGLENIAKMGIKIIGVSLIITESLTSQIIEKINKSKLPFSTWNAKKATSIIVDKQTHGSFNGGIMWIDMKAAEKFQDALKNVLDQFKYTPAKTLYLTQQGDQAA
jgi:hypothetical protein